ncbi:MAG: hypothetical protein QW815_09710, partial [Nitrososphaerota archaeon]
EQSYKRFRRFFGLFRGRPKLYNGAVRSALSRLTLVVLNNPKHRARDEERILRMIWMTVRGGPRERPESTGLNSGEYLGRQVSASFSGSREISLLPHTLSIPAFR